MPTTNIDIGNIEDENHPNGHLRILDYDTKFFNKYKKPKGHLLEC